MKETRWRKNGVVAIDDTLLPKTGKKIPGAAKFWDHNTNSYVYAQCIVTSHYVDRDKDYPIYLKQYLKLGSPEAAVHDFKTKVELALEHVDYCETLGSPVETYVFDAWFLCKKLTDRIKFYGKGWVSRLKVKPHSSPQGQGDERQGVWQNSVKGGLQGDNGAGQELLGSYQDSEC